MKRKQIQSVQEWLPFENLLENGIIKLKNSSYVTANTICSPTRLFTKRFPLPDSIREYVLRLSGDPKVCNWQLSLPESVHTEAVFF